MRRPHPGFGHAGIFVRLEPRDAVPLVATKLAKRVAFETRSREPSRISKLWFEFEPQFPQFWARAPFGGVQRVFLRVRARFCSRAVHRSSKTKRVYTLWLKRRPPLFEKQSSCTRLIFKAQPRLRPENKARVRALFSRRSPTSARKQGACTRFIFQAQPELGSNKRAPSKNASRT